MINGLSDIPWVGIFHRLDLPFCLEAVSEFHSLSEIGLQTPEMHSSAKVHYTILWIRESIDRFCKGSTFGWILCISIRQKLSFDSRERRNDETASLLGSLSCFVPGNACYSHLSRVRENLVIWGSNHMDPLDYDNKTLIRGAIFCTLYVALS